MDWGWVTVTMATSKNTTHQDKHQHSVDMLDEFMLAGVKRPVQTLEPDEAQMKEQQSRFVPDFQSLAWMGSPVHLGVTQLMTEGPV